MKNRSAVREFHVERRNANTIQPCRAIIDVMAISGIDPKTMGYRPDQDTPAIAGVALTEIL
jgi:hypothetical protein